MGARSEMHVGVVGAVGRGGSFSAGFKACGARIHAVCDTQADRLEEARIKLGASEAYTDFDTMLEKADLDAVVIGTPMPLHVPMSVAALRAGKHVMSEVTAGVSVEECRDLVRAVRQAKGIYMMAENYCYMEANVMVRELVRRGLFGTIYYAEGEYLHELKELNEITTWRRRWQTGVNGITYGTHSLGPILQWFEGQRVTSVCCAGSGHHYRDPRGAEYENEDTCVLLGRLSGGGLVKIRVDMLSNRPHNCTAYSLQGTDGCYESGRGFKDENKIWIRSACANPNEWKVLAEVATPLLPDWYVQGREAARKAGHGGGDYFEILDFIRAARGEAPNPIDVDRAMDMTLPGLISQASIARQGQWLDVPDSRNW
jgi:predicted dehydrogenase